MAGIGLFNDRLSQNQIKRFILFDDEELIFACREHILPLILRIIKQTIVGILLSVGATTIFLILGTPIIAVATFVLIILVSSIVSVRDLIHWSFHLYIATNKQIIEVQYDPLLSQAINSVLLDQIRCTEIDVSMFGVIPELLGVGSVLITFDRPTHKETFVIKNIRSPRQIASLLSAQIHQGLVLTKSNNLSQENNLVEKPLWIKELKKNKYRFIGGAEYGSYTN